VTRGLAGWSIALVAGQLYFYGKWWSWSGDDSWGPRLMVYATLAALIVVAASEAARSRAFAVLAMAGFCLQLPPVLIGPHTPLMISHMRGARVVAASSGGTGGGVALTLDDSRFIPPTRKSLILQTCCC